MSYSTLMVRGKLPDKAEQLSYSSAAVTHQEGEKVLHTEEEEEEEELVTAAPALC